MKKIILLLVLISIASFGRMSYTDKVEFKISETFSKSYYQDKILKMCDFEHESNFINLDDSVFKVMVTECDKYNLPYNMFFSLIDKESGFRSISNSTGSGASGYMQLMPKTFQNFSRKLGLKGGNTPTNNIKAGAFYLSQINKRWSHKYKSKKEVWIWTLAEYEAGLGGLQVRDSTGVVLYHIPDECNSGIDKVMKNY